MIAIAQISSWVGAVLLLFGLCGAIGALLVLPFKRLIPGNAPQGNVAGPTRPSTSFNNFGVGLNWLAWPIYAVLALMTFLNESFTLFSYAGFGFVYITLGMPTFLVAWLGLLIYGSIRPVPTSWLFGALGAAGLIALGYANIN